MTTSQKGKQKLQVAIEKKNPKNKKQKITTSHSLMQILIKTLMIIYHCFDGKYQQRVLFTPFILLNQSPLSFSGQLRVAFVLI